MATIIRNSIFLFFIAITSVAIASNKNYNSLKVGDKAPDFTVTDISGNQISLSSLRGKVILIDFWASWCGYCKIANEEFIPIYNKYQPQGFEIFSVSMDKRKEDWIKAIKTQQLPWPLHGSDLKGWEQSRIAQMYNIEVLPGTFLIDENGIILEMDLDEFDLEKKLNWYFNQQVRFFPVNANSKLLFTSKTKFQIENSNGDVFLKGKEQEVDISELSPGEYLVKFEDKSEKFVKRINTQSPVTFFPERADEKITLSSEAMYEIYNIKGKLIKSGTSNTIDITELTTGSYYISIEGNVHTFYKK